MSWIWTRMYGRAVTDSARHYVLVHDVAIREEIYLLNSLSGIRLLIKSRYDER